eukprot:9230711-Pyramimonas_sp.AAC.1
MAPRATERFLCAARRVCARGGGEVHGAVRALAWIQSLAETAGRQGASAGEGHGQSNWRASERGGPVTQVAAKQ